MADGLQKMKQFVNGYRLEDNQIHKTVAGSVNPPAGRMEEMNREMTEAEIFDILEEARMHSFSNGTVWAMENGERVTYTNQPERKNVLENCGFSLYATFEHGHEVFI